jgi:hypothetical protein
MEKVSILFALGQGVDVSSVFSDTPACTNSVIAQLAQTVNDRLGDEQRQRLNPLIPRLLRARRTDSDPRINLRIAIWSARKVLHLVREEDREVCEKAIDAAQGWLEGTVSNEELAATYAATNATNAANAAYAATYAAYATATATAAANAANAPLGDIDLVALLDEALDIWEEACSKEGEDIYVPQPWEDEALSYLN